MTRRHMLALTSTWASSWAPTLASTLTAAPIGAETPRPLSVFAAASLKNLLDEIAGLPTMPDIALSYGGSGLLARQISLGAPVDLFISADPKWIDTLAHPDPAANRAKHLGFAPRAALFTNRLVLIGPSKGPSGGPSGGPSNGTSGQAPVRLSVSDVVKLSPDARIAMGLVAAVPAGQYGKAAFESLGLWETVAPRVVEMDNVRAALAAVARKELPLGVVYATDAQAEPRVKVLAEFPAQSHPQILYEMFVPAQAAIWQAPDRSLRAFADILRSDDARAIYARHGFGLL